jgi:hypothetical protein
MTKSRPGRAPRVVALVAVAAAALLGACKMRREPAASAVKDGPGTARPKPNLVFVFAGGFHSCTNNPVDKKASPYGLNFLPKLKQFTDRTVGKVGAVRWVVSCFDTSMDELAWYTSSAPTELKIAKDPLVVGKPAEEQYFTALVDEIQTAMPSPHIMLVGHSWGGSLMMDTTFRLVKAGFNDLQLYTIDAISRRLCTAESFFSIIKDGLAGKAFADCLRAPFHVTDNTSAGELRKVIVGGVNDPEGKNRWWNFYQEDFGLLHSGPIDELPGEGRGVQPRGCSFNAPAHNCKIPMRSLFNPLAPHTEIPRDDTVWFTIADLFFTPLGILPPPRPAFAPPVAIDPNGRVDVGPMVAEGVAELESAFPQDPVKDSFFLEFAPDFAKGREGKAVVQVRIVFRDAAARGAARVAANARVASVRKMVEDAEGLKDATIEVSERLDGEPARVGSGY